MKKLFALLLALAMVLSLAACGASEAPATEAPKAEAPATKEILPFRLMPDSRRKQAFLPQTPAA